MAASAGFQFFDLDETVDLEKEPELVKKGWMNLSGAGWWRESLAIAGEGIAKGFAFAEAAEHVA